MVRTVPFALFFGYLYGLWMACRYIVHGSTWRGGYGRAACGHLVIYLTFTLLCCVSSKQVAAEKAKAEAEKDLDPWFSEAEAEDNTVRLKTNPDGPCPLWGALFVYRRRNPR